MSQSTHEVEEQEPLTLFKGVYKIPDKKPVEQVGCCLRVRRMLLPTACSRFIRTLLAQLRQKCRLAAQLSKLFGDKKKQSRFYRKVVLIEKIGF